MNENRHITFEKCIFKCIDDNKIIPKFISKVQENKNGITINSCIFNKELDMDRIKLGSYITQNNPNSHTLAHYTVENACKAHGCQNNTCPPDAFSFKHGDKYCTEKLYFTTII